MIIETWLNNPEHIENVSKNTFNYKRPVIDEFLNISYKEEILFILYFMIENDKKEILTMGIAFDNKDTLLYNILVEYSNLENIKKMPIEYWQGRPQVFQNVTSTVFEYDKKIYNSNEDFYYEKQKIIAFPLIIHRRNPLLKFEGKKIYGIGIGSENTNSFLYKVLSYIQKRIDKKQVKEKMIERLKKNIL